MFREEEEGEGPEGESIILRVRAPSRAAGQSHATPIQQRHTTIYSTLRAEREMRLGRQPVGVFFSIGGSLHLLGIDKSRD